MTMLATSVRDRPWSERLRRSSSGRVTVRTPSSRAISIGLATLWLKVPFGPLTVTSWPSIETSTPLGTSMGSRPMRDMACLPYQT